MIKKLLDDLLDYHIMEKSFTAHSNVLKFRSSYFRRELENIQPNENNIKIIIKSSISAQILMLFFTADEFELEELSNKLETLLIETKGTTTLKN
ncbi:hypothetical protein Glove_177g158 [Diversispora epigaea]|uniref:BTB domain-containing protein n=1 Tax=Diversispora epigaea TaxID=1348612 RepID=A0A397IT40_9GLOM|nr:hypothetical protein Glove_177g158 [Diversispora epigaea]